MRHNECHECGERWRTTVPARRCPECGSRDIETRRPSPWLILGTLGALSWLALVVAVCGGLTLRSSSPSAPSSPTSSTTSKPEPVQAPVERTTRPRDGDTVYLLILAHPGRDLILARDDASLREMTRLANRGDDRALEGMLADGRLFLVPARTRATVTSAGFLSSTIRILEGTHAGRAGVIVNDHLHKAP